MPGFAKSGAEFSQRLGLDAVRDSGPHDLASAERFCAALAARHYENFSVVSRLAPREYRQPLANIYAYCRIADDFADTATSATESLALLDDWERQLDAVFGDATAGPRPRHPVFVALEATIQQFQLPIEPFRDLLVAFRQDQSVTRYDTVESLVGYCRNSANPVGRLVLHLGRSASQENLGLSDAICTGLQWINFCQDVWRDWQLGRMYLPEATRAAAGYSEELLARRHCNAAFRRWLHVEVERAEQWLRAGEPLVARVAPGLRLPVALFVGGGLTLVAKIRRLGYNTLHVRPTVTRLDKLRLVAATWRRLRRSRTGAPDTRP